MYKCLTGDTFMMQFSSQMYSELYKNEGDLAH